ncbi:NgoMIV family type II restriction endonuclease [Micromonospora chalcea]|uniref:NgoMIV family type II restriction endonuclease n=1 Tax=Micromonospora chalcea TaxID=1874 RepID=UPI000CE42774|nr:NgoMIV family type II restriction endonuclease [Micromonospora chalcea]
MSAPAWFAEKLGWKKATAKTAELCQKAFGLPYGPNLADLSGSSSTLIAGEAYRILGIPTSRRTDFDIGALEASRNEGDGEKLKRIPAAGTALEEGLRRDIEESLYSRVPGDGDASGRKRWYVTRSGDARQFAQYEHLARLQKLFEEESTLKTTVGRDYQVSTDVMVGVPSHWAGTQPYMLHAALSSKLTIRSDRVQNIRVEFGTLVRNRRGRLPHLVVVTAEPLPSRIISIARGTGEIDAIYHLLYDEIDEALHLLRGQSRHLTSQADGWEEMVAMKRLRPYRELAEVLVSG